MRQTGCAHIHTNILYLNKNNRCHEIPQAVRQWRPAGMRQPLRYIMVGVPAFREARLPTSRPLYQTLWSGNTQLLMNWTGMVPLVSKCADWSEEENSRVSAGGVRAVITVVWEWVCVCECCTDLTTLVPSTTTQQQHSTCTAALEGLQASMDGGQYKPCGDRGIANQGEQSRRRGRGRTFLLKNTKA